MKILFDPNSLRISTIYVHNQAGSRDCTYVQSAEGKKFCFHSSLSAAQSIHYPPSCVSILSRQQNVLIESMYLRRITLEPNSVEHDSRASSFLQVTSYKSHLVYTAAENDFGEF